MLGVCLVGGRRRRSRALRIVRMDFEDSQDGL